MFSRPRVRRQHWLHLQRRFAETPFEIPIAAYFAVIGITGVVSGNGITPSTLEAALPIWLVQAWTVGLAAGGLFTVWGRVGRSESSRVESAGLILLGYGSTLYAGVLLVSGSFPATLFAAAAMIAIATGCAIRVLVLRDSGRAQCVATEIEDDHRRRP